MTPTRSTAFMVEIQALQKLLAEKNAEIERLANIIRATEMERDAGDKVADNLRTKIERLKSLLARTADGLDGATKMLRTDSESKLIAELRKAAE